MSLFLKDFLTPCKNCAIIVPELPRADSNAKSAIISNDSPTLSGIRLLPSSIIGNNVKHMLVPVSPSGTGKTLISSNLVL